MSLEGERAKNLFDDMCLGRLEVTLKNVLFCRNVCIVCNAHFIIIFVGITLDGNNENHLCFVSLNIDENEKYQVRC